MRTVSAQAGLARRVILIVVAGLVSSISINPASSQNQPAGALQPDPWVCTAIPRRFWLPLGVLKERLNDEGYTVLDAAETRDDCYAFRLRDRESRETTVIFDPVSAKPLR